MDSFALVEDLVNLQAEGVTFETGKSFVAKWNFGNHLHGCVSFYLRNGGGQQIFMDENQKKQAESIHKVVSVKVYPCNSQSHASTMSTINTPGIKEDFTYRINKLSEEAVLFTNQCRTTKSVLFDFINERFALIQRNHPIFRFSGSVEQPRLNLGNIPIPYATLEDEIEIKAYLVPFIDGQGAQWVRSRFCDECGRFFFYKLERARFCSKLCRIRANNKRRSSK